MKKIHLKALVFSAIVVLAAAAPSFAAEEDIVNTYDAEIKAREAHRIASSDMMYQNEEWKAIYYQNQSIIQLLKQIRDSLETIKSQGWAKNEVEK